MRYTQTTQNNIGNTFSTSPRGGQVVSFTTANNYQPAQGIISSDHHQRIFMNYAGNSGVGSAGRAT